MKLTDFILALPKTLFFNFKYFKFKDALKLPIIISRQTKLHKTKGSISILSPLKTGMIQIGFGNVGIFDKKYSRTILEIDGEIVFQERAFIGHGSKISIGKQGKVYIGNNVRSSAELTLVCQQEIVLKENVLFSWETLVIDTDFHHTINTQTNERSKTCHAPIVIENNVWVGARSIILKGSYIPAGCIIGSGSVITKKKDIEPESLLAGNPAVIKKRHITLDLD